MLNGKSGGSGGNPILSNVDCRKCLVPKKVLISTRSPNNKWMSCEGQGETTSPELGICGWLGPLARVCVSSPGKRVCIRMCLLRVMYSIHMCVCVRLCAACVCESRCELRVAVWACWLTNERFCSAVKCACVPCAAFLYTVYANRKLREISRALLAHIDC